MPLELIMRDCWLRPLSLKHISSPRVPEYLIRHSPAVDTVRQIYPYSKVISNKVKKVKTENMSIYVIHHYLQLVLEGKVTCYILLQQALGRVLRSCSSQVFAD